MCQGVDTVFCKRSMKMQVNWRKLWSVWLFKGYVVHEIVSELGAQFANYLKSGLLASLVFGLSSRFRGKMREIFGKSMRLYEKYLLYSMWKSYDKFSSSWWHSTSLTRIGLSVKTFQPCSGSWNEGGSLLPSSNFFSYGIYLNLLFPVCCLENCSFILCTEL